MGSAGLESWASSRPSRPNRIKHQWDAKLREFPTNAGSSLWLSRRFVRLARPIQCAQELLSSLAADVHHIGIIRDLAQNRRYRVQFLSIFFFLIIRQPPKSTLFPHTALSL